MFWQQIWTHGAMVTRDRLPPEDVSAICAAVETFIQTGRGAVRRVTPTGGTLIAGAFQVDFILERDAQYDAGDGEESTGDVCWVIDIYAHP